MFCEDQKIKIVYSQVPGFKSAKLCVLQKCETAPPIKEAVTVFESSVF